MPYRDRVAAFLLRRDIRGAHKFHAKLCGGRRLEVESKHGLRLLLDPYEYVDSQILRFGYYEEEVLDGLLSDFHDGDVVWDIGANIGLHALTIAKLRPTAQVSAFEPNPALNTLIQSAARRNALMVNTVSTALDSVGGTARLYLSPGNAGMSSLHNWGADPQQPSIDVTTARAEDLVAASQISSPNIVKIDVEGNEDRVLSGMSRLLANPRLHTIVFEDSTQEATKAKEILYAAGFQINPLSRREATHHHLDNYVAKR